MYNLQGDVIGLTDAATGKVIAKYLYDAWGKIVSVKNASGYTIGTANPFRYRGYYYDQESQLYYLNSRYYDAEIGRFISADSQLNEGVLGYNMFAYCENNPVNGSDPDGDMVWWAAAVLGGAVFEVVSYLIGNAVSGQKSTWKGAAKSALRGAIEGVAFGAVGKGIQAVSKAAKVAKAAKVSTNAIKSESAATGKGFDSFRQLKKQIGSPGTGREWHHIVEQNQIGKSGFDPQMVHNTNNIIAVDKTAHKSISGYYSSKQPFTSGMRVRDWLVGQSYEVQYEFGLNVVKMFT